MRYCLFPGILQIRKSRLHIGNSRSSKFYRYFLLCLLEITTLHDDSIENKLSRGFVFGFLKGLTDGYVSLNHPPLEQGTL